MCGIAGVIHPKGRRPDRSILTRMIAAIDHRGPDENGIFVDDQAGLAHARLSIIDLSGGRQPMSASQDSLWITYNGEVFNYVELREEMESEGVRFATRSDTEVVLRNFRRRGADCVHDFNGQWAFGVWDSRRRELFLSRDRVGIRPLYYTLVDGSLIFASEIKAILCHPSVSRCLDLQGLDQVFTCWHPLGGRTLLRGIRSLPPGCNLRFRDGQVSIERYWSFGYPEQTRPGSVEDLSQQLRELLIDAVRVRLRADVPVGAYLSGGLDSTTVTALVKHYTDTSLRTFSVTFAHSEYDESSFQQRASDHLGTDHCAVFCSDRQIGEVFPQVVWHAEAPLLRTAPAPLYLLSRLVRENGYKVVLTGEGADEVLGGYDIFKETKIRRFWAAAPDSRRRPLLLQRLYPYLNNLQRLSPAYLQRFFHIDPDALKNPFFSHLPRWDMTGGLKVFLSDEVRAELRGYDVQEELRASLPPDFGRWPTFCQAQYLEATGLMPGYILSSQGDRMSMGHSVEGRFPFLDHRVVEFAAGLQVNLKMRGLNEKYILKRAVADLLPTEVLDRPKQPYRAPDAVSFVPGPDGPPPPDYVNDLLDRQRVEQYGLFRADAVDKLVQKARQGKLTGVRDNMAFVAILSTQLLVHQFLDQPGKIEAHERVYAAR